MAEHRRASGEGETGIRELILDAALATLAEKGIQGLSQVQIARKAGIRQSHLTYYFPRRSDLIEAIAGRFALGLADRTHQAFADPGAVPPAALIRQLASSIRDRSHMRLFTAAIVEADHDPEVRSILAEITRRIQTALARHLEGPDAETRAGMILATLWGLGLNAFFGGDTSDLDLSLLDRWIQPENTGT